jgi:hypothetical protein
LNRISEELQSISVPNTPPKKKKKLQYKQAYLKKWEETFAWVAPASSEDRAYCKLCKKNMSISHMQNTKGIEKKKKKRKCGVNKL